MCGEHGTLSTDAVCKLFQPGVVGETIVYGAIWLKKSSTTRMRRSDDAHCAWDSKLPIVKAEMHNRFGVPTHDTAASISGETVEHSRNYVPGSGQAVRL